MSSSYTLTEAIAFTVTHARHIGAKVATDLKRIQRFYGQPTDAAITSYEAELVEFLKEGYLGTVTYGFRRNNEWIEPTLQYTARDLVGAMAADDDPGRIRPGADVSNASFYTYLTYSAAWDSLSDAGKDSFKGRLPFQREGAPEPGVNGYLSRDRTYSAGGRSLDRATLRTL